ncbi:helix-turn-helix domain-containing protein, partial [Bacillus paranthracis]
MNEIGIKQKRERLGITQKEFADALGLGKNGDRTLRRWENGESVPSPLELKAIMDFPEDPPFLPPNDPH